MLLLLFFVVLFASAFLFSYVLMFREFLILRIQVD